jgi:spore coat protein U-like protein
MEKHEGNRMGRRLPRRARLVAGATALVSALALSAPAVAGATSYNQPITITQNTSMIVDVSTLNYGMYSAVSWGDVSWSDCF